MNVRVIKVNRVFFKLCYYLSYNMCGREIFERLFAIKILAVRWKVEYNAFKLQNFLICWSFVYEVVGLLKLARGR